jgi:ABC-2 type transport system permease protein
MSAAPSFWKPVAAQTRAELVLASRRGENLLITMLVPPLLLVLFASMRFVPGDQQNAVDYLLPGMLALAVISTGMVSVGISTAYERHYGVLKLLGSSPLPRSGLLLAKMLSVAVVEVCQVAVLFAVAAVGYGWRPAGNAWGVVLALAVGTAAFTALGLLMAGRLRAEATLAAANALYVLFLIIGDVVLPLDHLPGVTQAPAQVLLPAAFTDVLRGAFGQPVPAWWISAGALAVWTVVLIVATVRTFRWE